VSDVEAPKIGDTRPAPELGVLEPDPRDVRIAELEDELARATPPPQLREFAERVQARNATECGAGGGEQVRAPDSGAPHMGRSVRRLCP
jgi:hypothetical protein